MKAVKITLRILGMLLLLIGFDFAIQRYPYQLHIFAIGWILVLVSFFLKTSNSK